MKAISYVNSRFLYRNRRPWRLLSSLLLLTATLAVAQTGVEDKARPGQAESGKPPAVATRTAPDSGPEGKLYTSKQLIGLKVKNPQGEELGEIEDLAIDWRAGRVAYAILSYGGLLSGARDLENKLFAVPAGALSLTSSPGDRSGSMLLAIDKERLKEIKGFDQYDWPNMESREWGEQVHRQYDQLAQWEKLAPKTGPSATLEQAGAHYMQAQSTGSLQKASDLLGMEVQDADGEKVGKIQELAIDWQTARVEYARVAVGGVLGLGDKELGIPLEAMTLAARAASAPIRFSKENYLKLKVRKGDLEKSGFKPVR